MTINYPAYDDDRLQTIEQESFKTLEPGDYDFEVTKATEGESKTSGNPMITLELLIWDNNGITHNVKDWLVVTDKMIYKFKQFWNCVSKPEMYGQPVEAYEFEGLTGKVKTRLEEKEMDKKDGSGVKLMKFVRIESYLPGLKKIDLNNPNLLKEVTDDMDDDIPF